MNRMTDVQQLNKRQKTDRDSKDTVKITQKILDYLRFSLQSCIFELEAKKLIMTGIRT